MVVVVAAGNHGPAPGTVTTPGISRKVITVGCSDDDREVEVMGSRMVDYSGRGPTNACVCKPDLVAPGCGIISCCNEPGRYFIKSGTSMSTPLVSGAIALLLEKYPSMSNKDVKLRIRERAVDLGLPHNQQGWGKLDVKDCWQMKYDLIICQQPAKNIVFYFSQRPEAPHGSTRPFWETGRPTSSAFTVPPNFGTISTPII